MGLPSYVFPSLSPDDFPPEKCPVIERIRIYGMIEPQVTYTLVPQN